MYKEKKHGAELKDFPSIFTISQKLSMALAQKIPPMSLEPQALEICE